MKVYNMYQILEVEDKMVLSPIKLVFLDYIIRNV